MLMIMNNRKRPKNLRKTVRYLEETKAGTTLEVQIIEEKATIGAIGDQVAESRKEKIRQVGATIVVPAYLPFHIRSCRFEQQLEKD